ncbi:MAG TPA: cupin domain-containing protein [Spongiibacteraceae bacterium]|jgi:quercetin dioxygenase-like cupin family protein|nr:cupin domain-containing protein [Spongiibacteraceae bacterium]HUH36774.1 cupin domain-containing protein [Spongiibacteraceae bacterium]
MATHHASPFEIVDLESWADDLPREKTKVVAKTPDMELARLVIGAGERFPDHRVTGPIVVHCVEGEIEFSAGDETKTLKTNQLLYLQPGVPHSLRGIKASVVLLTIVFKH